MPPAAMIRFALGPDGAATPDLAAKLPGRGAWVRADRAAIEKAAAKGLFARAFKAPATLGEGRDASAFADWIGDLVERRALDALGLARKAGDLFVGFDVVKTALKDGKAVALITARDTSEDGAEKLARIARASGVAVVRAFASDALSAALGRDGLKHAALKPGPAGARFLAEAQRLAGFDRAKLEAPEDLAASA